MILNSESAEKQNSLNNPELIYSKTSETAKLGRPETKLDELIASFEIGNEADKSL